MANFKNKVALITGGTCGIGFATAKLFAQSNAKIFIVGRNSERGKQALERLSAITPDAYFWPADISQPEQVEQMIAKCIEVFGRLDIAINNAAASFPLVPIAEIPLAAIDESIATDLRGTWCCMKHEINAMLKTGGGAIVNVSSTNGIAASPDAGMYSATKHGVNGLTSAAAREYIARGMRINTVCPGAIDTPRRQRRLEGKSAAEIAEHDHELEKIIPAQRVGRADEIAAPIVWLCSDEASYVVGHHLVIDGGLTA